MADKDNHLATCQTNILPALPKGQVIKTYIDTQVSTLKQVIELKQEPIGLLIKNNEEQVKATIEFAIIDLMQFVNVGRTMNEAQIMETARLIVRQHAYLTIPDIKLVFDRIKSGQIQIYEGLDGMKILRVFHHYKDERAKEIEEANFSEHMNHTGDEKRKRLRDYSGEPNKFKTLKSDESFFEKLKSTKP